MSGESFEDWSGVGPAMTAPSITVMGKGAAPATAASPPPEGYQAFGIEHPESRGEVIEIRRSNGEWCQVERRFLKRVDGAGERFLAIVCTDFAVMITGQRLGDLRRRLSARKVDYIQEYDRNRWPMILTDAPVVERVELITADGPIADGLAARRPA